MNGTNCSVSYEELRRFYVQFAAEEDVQGNAVDDATWVLTSSFVILTMQSGFGLLESGYVHQKNAVSIMMKNVADVVFGGLSYWIVGYGVSYGSSFHGIMGISDYFFDPDILDSFTSGWRSSHYIFQFSFAATATTIVSGAVAGRLKFSAYILFSFLNTLVYALPAHWVWHEDGWLFKLDFIDFAGDGPVHLLGGISGLVGAVLLGPRKGRFTDPKFDEFPSPSSAIFGMFMLWWGWLGFNCGSTFGITGDKWIVAARVAVTTINSSIAGAATGFLYSWWTLGHVCVDQVITGLLGGLVAITSPCAAVAPKYALVIGFIACLLGIWSSMLVQRLKIDDPVNAIGVHGVCAIWGLISAGLFADSSLPGGVTKYSGLFHGGGAHLLGIQILGTAAIVAWTLLTSAVTFAALHLLLKGLRVNAYEEEMGSDWVEHKFHHNVVQAARSGGDGSATKATIMLRSAITSVKAGVRLKNSKKIHSASLLSSAKVAPDTNCTLPSRKAWPSKEKPLEDGIINVELKGADTAPRSRVLACKIVEKTVAPKTSVDFEI